MIPYRVTSEIWLSLEDFYSNGVTPEQAKQVIEDMPDPGGSLNLSCEGSGFNHNWIVRTQSNNPDVHREIVWGIWWRLTKFMEK